MISEESFFFMLKKYLKPTVSYSYHMINYLFFSWFQRKFFTFMVKKCLKSAVCYMSYHVFLFNHSCTEKFLLSTSKLGIFYFDSTAIIYTIFLPLTFLWQFKYQVCSWFTALTEVSALYVIQNS